MVMVIVQVETLLRMQKGVGHVAVDKGLDGLQEAVGWMRIATVRLTDVVGHTSTTQWIWTEESQRRCGFVNDLFFVVILRENDGPTVGGFSFGRAPLLGLGRIQVNA